jgi:hypothetical protein
MDMGVLLTGTFWQEPYGPGPIFQPFWQERFGRNLWVSRAFFAETFFARMFR